MKNALVASVAALCLTAVAQAAPISYFAYLNGTNEAPPNASPGTGIANVTLDVAVHTMLVQVTFTGLVAPNTAAHIHCCTTVPFTGTAGVATSVPTFTDFPSGTTSGSYTHLFDTSLASSYNPAFVTAQGGSVAAAEAALAAGMASGQTYLNIHSSTFPNGEIRGFLTPVPEPATMLLVGGVLFGLVRAKRKRA